MENKVLNEILDNNLEIIKKYDIELANNILMFDKQKSNPDSSIAQNSNQEQGSNQSLSFDSNLQISTTQQNEYNLVYKGYCLHDQQGALDEARRIANVIDDDKNSIKVVYGLGLGYVADELAQKINNGKIIIYEPSLEIIHYVLSIAQIDALLKDNVFLCNDKETLAQYVVDNTNQDSKMKLIYTKAYKQIFEEDFNQVTQIIQKSQGQHSANVNTILTKSPQAVYNTYSNLDKIFNLPYIAQFKDIYKNKTALIISAGPSLKENIEIIKQNQDKFIIFCVNVAMEYVLSEGIRVDFVVDIETAGSNYHYKNVDLSNSYLILESFSNLNKYKVKTKGTITYISKNNFLNAWLRDCLNIDDDLETMGTVSYTALDCAYIMGFSKIILIGQDLAFKNGQCYAKGSIYEDLECVFDKEKNKYIIQAKDFDKYTLKLMGSTTDLAKKNTKRYIETLNKNIYTIKSQDNTYLPTQVGYALFVEWFERAAKKYKEQTINNSKQPANNPIKQDDKTRQSESLTRTLELINSSTGGAQINGFENISLDCAIGNDSVVERIELNLEPINFNRENCINKINEQIERMIPYNLLSIDIMNICEKFLNELKIKKIITPNALKLMKKHNDIINLLLNFNADSNWRIIQARFNFLIIPQIEKNFAKDIRATKETFENLLEIYKKMSTQTTYYLNKLKETKTTLESY